jgi:hypothetical protein
VDVLVDVLVDVEVDVEVLVDVLVDVDVDVEVLLDVEVASSAPNDTKPHWAMERPAKQAVMASACFCLRMATTKLLASMMVTSLRWST